MMYATVVFLHVYRHRRRQIYDAYSENFWDGAKQAIAAVLDAQATYWNGRYGATERTVNNHKISRYGWIFETRLTGL